MGSNSKENDESNRESYDAIRCAKAAMLLLSLGSSRDHQEKEMMRQQIEDLKIELVRERVKRKNVKLCVLLELVLKIVLPFALCIFFLMFAVKSG